MRNVELNLQESTFWQSLFLFVRKMILITSRVLLSFLVLLFEENKAI